MSYDFKFGDTWLSEFGGVTSKKPGREVAVYDGTLINIPGMNGDEYIDNGRYKNVPITREVAFNGRRNGRVGNLPERIINWLAYLHGYQDFEDTMHDGFVTKAVLTNFPEVVTALNDRFNTASLKFSRHPFWYSKTALIDDPIDLTAASVTFHNPFKAPSEPLLRFYLDITQQSAATIKYTIQTGGVTTEYTMANIPVSQCFDIHVDCERKEVYTPTAGAPDYLNVEMPKEFAPGDTVLTVTEGKSRISELLVAPRWRCLE